jgi:hypothetical protein
MIPSPIEAACTLTISWSRRRPRLPDTNIHNLYPYLKKNIHNLIVTEEKKTHIYIYTYNPVARSRDFNYMNLRAA